LLFPPCCYFSFLAAFLAAARAAVNCWPRFLIPLMRVASAGGSRPNSSLSNRASPWMVMIRATSRLAFLVSVGRSSRSVADWKRRWKRFLTTSLSDRLSWSSLISRYSEDFIGPSLYFHPLGAGNPAHPMTRRLTNRQRNGILYATRARQSRALVSGRPA